MTAADLLAALRPFGPAVDGDELAFDLDPSADLEPLLRILHTGIRALLTRRTWYGCGSDKATAAAVVLNPAAPIPRGITLLCVEGDSAWDRIHPAATIDCPSLFARDKQR